MKYRYEIKYIINNKDAELLKSQLKYLLHADTNAKNPDGTYLIKSLYFDTVDADALYEKNDGVLNRRKFRIRYYDNDPSFIRLEKKMKHNNMTAKQQCEISKTIYDALLDGRFRLIRTKKPLLEEFLSLLEVQHLVPSVVVEYSRQAFTYPVSDVRITFDSCIKTGRYCQDPMNQPSMMYDVLEPNMQVLEVKFNEVLPSAIAVILQSVPLCREAVSKFARCAAWK